MSRKRCRRQVWPKVPPKGLRPRLACDQLLDLSLAHHENLDAIATGRATAETMWQAMGGVLTWLYVAAQLDVGLPEMRVQHGVMLAVVERWRRTGRVGFSGPEYQLAKEGVMVMDALAERADSVMALAAAELSERQVNEMAAAEEAKVPA